MSTCVRCEILSETTMNNKKSPGLLGELALLRLFKMIDNACVMMYTELRCAQVLTWKCRLKMFDLVLDHCYQLRQLVMSQPELERKQLSYHTFQAVVNVVSKYHVEVPSRVSNSTFRIRYEEVCLYMIRAAFLPCINTCDIEEIQSEFVQELVVQSLDANQDVTYLMLPRIQNSRIMRFVSGNIHMLTVLQVFVHRRHCTTDIVIELGRHCTLLRLLDVRFSTHVSDDCIEYLLKLRNLEDLYLGGTAISQTCYSLILSSLPRIENIQWCGPVDIIFKNITKKCLPLVKIFSGEVSDPSLLTKMCPRIKRLYVRLLSENSLELTRLTDVVYLQLLTCDYSVNNLSIIILNMGIALTNLEMCGITKVSIIEIFSSCSVLKRLVVKFCEVIMSEDLILPNELPHFRSVAIILLENNTGFESFTRYLHRYDNLEVFHAHHVTEIQDASVRAILTSGGFRNLSELVLRECGPLTLPTALLLIGCCDRLGLLGKLKTWSGVSDKDIDSLIKYVKTNNLELTVE